MAFPFPCISMHKTECGVRYQRHSFIATALGLPFFCITALICFLPRFLTISYHYITLFHQNDQMSFKTANNFLQNLAALKVWYQWLNAKETSLQCASNEITFLLHEAFCFKTSEIWWWDAFTHIWWQYFLIWAQRLQVELEQLERLHSEILPAAPWLSILVIHIRSQVKSRQSQSYYLKKLPKIAILQKTLNATYLLKLLGKMYEYEMDPTRIVGATERTYDVGLTRDGRGMDRRMDGRTEWNQYTPNNFIVRGV